MKKKIVLIIVFLSFCFNIYAQDYKYFKVDTPFVGFVELTPLSNEQRVYNEKSTVVYLKNEYGKYILQTLNELETAIPSEIWSKLNAKDKDNISFNVYFDKAGDIFKMNITLPDEVYINTTDEQWNRFCNKFKAINVLNYVEVLDADKNNFVYSMMSVRPYRYLKNVLKDLRN